jgi:hypothetical protein
MADFIPFYVLFCLVDYENNKRKNSNFLLFFWRFSSFTKAGGWAAGRVQKSYIVKSSKMVQLKSTVEQLGCCRMDS